MTDEEIEAAKTVKKNAIKVYINDSDPTRALIAVQILLSAVVNNAGSLDNLTLLNTALDARLGGTP